MKQGTIGLLNSKRGVFCLLIVALAFALVLLKQLTGAQWVDFAKWIAGILVAGHTATGAVETWTGKNAAPVVPAQPLA